MHAAESDDGSVTLNDGLDLIGGARDMLLSATCSFRVPRPVYRAAANREAADLARPEPAWHGAPIQCATRRRRPMRAATSSSAGVS